MVVSILSRPGDAPGYALRIRAQLRVLAPSVDVHLEPRRNMDVLLVVVGPNWSASAPDGATVAAIEAALRAKQQVIPVLVQDASMPSARDLPTGIRPFSTIKARTLHNDAFAAGLKALLDGLSDDREGPWRDGDASGRIHIVSVRPGLALRVIRRLDSEQPVSVRVDGATHGSLHLFGDEMTLAVAPGRHEVLLRSRWEDPVEVDVPANKTVVLTATRSVLTGAVTIARPQVK